MKIHVALPVFFHGVTEAAQKQGIIRLRKTQPFTQIRQSMLIMIKCKPVKQQYCIYLCVAYDLYNGVYYISKKIHAQQIYIS